MLSATTMSPDMPTSVFSPAWRPPTYSVGPLPSVPASAGVTATPQPSPGTSPYTGMPVAQPMPPACMPGYHYVQGSGCVMDSSGMPPTGGSSSSSSVDVPTNTPSGGGTTATVQPQTQAQPLIATAPGVIAPMGSTPWWVWGLGGLAAVGAAGGLWYVVTHR